MRGGRGECPTSNRCGDQGPLIQFPFRLKGQPHHCGYPGFVLSCTENNQIMLELPDSVKLLVKNIIYKSREIIVQNPDNCLERQLRNLRDVTFFNCSLLKTAESFAAHFIPCLSIPGNPVYAVDSFYPLQNMDLSSCRRLYNASVGYHVFTDYTFNGSAFSLKWPKSICGSCLRGGHICRLKKSVSKQAMVTGTIFGFFLLVLVIAMFYRLYSSDKLERENGIKVKRFLEDYEALKPSRYSYADIKRITNQFKDKLGQGGYGTVYKGKLSHEVFVAVKILNNSQGNGEEFINEVATMGTIHHVNIVRLVGFCYLPNESLEKFIFSRDVKNYSLAWKKLQEIAIGIAKGIEYLHQAKLCSKEQSAVSMTVARGTIGYIAPEVLSRNFGNVSYKSDVYSFGMLLLEMVGGRKNIDVSVERDVEIAKKLAIVGLSCIQWFPMDRPSMKIVVQMLEGRGKLTMPPNPFASTTPTKTNLSKPEVFFNKG
ncbi:hypothetical protein AAG906_012944 [Vitis piasezkii]